MLGAVPNSGTTGRRGMLVRTFLQGLHKNYPKNTDAANAVILFKSLKIPAGRKICDMSDKPNGICIRKGGLTYIIFGSYADH